MYILFQIKYSFSCLQCPVVQKSGATGTLKPTPLPALNVNYNFIMRNYFGFH